jgi:hypothetical protein
MKQGRYAKIIQQGAAVYMSKFGLPFLGTLYLFQEPYLRHCPFACILLRLKSGLTT